MHPRFPTKAIESSIKARRVRAYVVIARASLLAVGACAAQQADVRTFPEACPKGWKFLYADYAAQGSHAAPPAVCRRDSTTAFAD